MGHQSMAMWPSQEVGRRRRGGAVPGADVSDLASDELEPGPSVRTRGRAGADPAQPMALQTGSMAVLLLSVVGDPGTGKTTCIRHLCAHLPRPRYRVLYHCDTTLSPTGIYRALAGELGLRPHHRRSQLWQDIKRTLLHLVDEQHIQPVLVLDEAHHLPDAFLLELAAFLNYAFDSRDLLTLWLVGQPALHRRLQTQQHEALAMRVVMRVVDALPGSLDACGGTTPP